uniref:CS domain-containing protein n=1 Tax=Leersia perrieri TaxID=77586 RepID=A0A0D9WQF6_9ORYZ
METTSTTSALGPRSQISAEEELRRLEGLAKRPRVLSALANEIRTVHAKIYVFLEGVEQDKVETTFKPMSVDIKFHDVKGKNYGCAIPKLNKEIVPEKCKILVKPTKIVVTLYKASKGNWLDLHFKEDKG